MLRHRPFAVCSGAFAIMLCALAGARAGSRTPEPAIYWIFLEPAFARSTLPPAVGDGVLRARSLIDSDRPVAQAAIDAVAATGPRVLLDSDRPVAPAAIDDIAATGARVLYASRWLRAIAVEADARTLMRIARMDGVQSIRAARVGYEAGAAGLPGSPLVAISRQQDSATYGPTYAALRELNIPILHAELGLTGTAVRVGIVDSGFFLLHEALDDRFVGAQRDFIDNDNNTGPEGNDAPNQARHGTHIMSLLGGYAPGTFVGGAYGAHFFLAKVKEVGEDTRADEVRWVAGVEWLDSLGVRIINSSIGFRYDFADQPDIPYGDLDGNTTITTRMSDEAARRGILMVVAIGNRGPASGTLWAPADADSAITVGSIDSLLANRTARPSDVSSRGPTADGRTKPELAARGGNIIAASMFATNAYESGLSGSSYAAPLISAGAALFIEAWQPISPPSVMAVRNALVLAGSDVSRPNNVTGFGVPDVAAAIMMPSGLTLVPLGSMDLPGNVTTIAPTFRWEAPLIHPRMTPITYRVDVATDPNFQDIAYSETMSDAFAHTVRAPLRPLPVAYWRVTATSAQGIQRASNTGSLRVPPWVRLLTLADARPEFINESQPELSWSPLQAPAPIGPFTYDVQILSATNQVIQQVRNLNSTSTRVPEPLTPNASYRWRVIARTTTGVADTVESAAPFVVLSSEAPPATLLYKPFPSPFPSFEAGPRTNVWFDLQRESRVELAVYDLRGRLVRMMIPAHPACPAVTLPAGLYGRSGQVFDVPAAAADQPCAVSNWDGTDMRGERVPRGVYIIRLRAGGVTNTQPVLFLPN